MASELMVRPSTTVPAGEWNLMTMQAEVLARSDIIPRAYQRKPANVLVAAITGRQYGWDVLTAMRNGNVIEGQWSMSPEAMVGLVLAAGHSVKGTMTAEGATVTGTRANNGDTMTVTFTIDDAVQAELVQLKNGKPWARSSNGKRLPWELYPKTMCWWRAAGLLCRVLFADITAGVYSAEELGAPIDEDGRIIDVGEIEHSTEPMPLSDDALAKFAEACEQIGVSTADVLAVAFGPDVPDPLTEDHLPKMRDAYRFLAEEQAMEKETETADESNVGSAGTEDEDRPASRHQVGKIKGEYSRLGMEDRDAQLDNTARIIGRTITSHNELGRIEANIVIEALMALDPPA